MNRTSTRAHSAFFLLVAVCLATTPTPSRAQQDVTPGTFRYDLFANSPAESYLRYLQTEGRVPVYPWSSRAFSLRELKHLIPTDSAHPWSARLREDSRQLGPVRYSPIEPTISLRYNSAFAYGSNDGPLWAGRGITSALQAGVQASWGPATLTLAPMLFRAENKRFSTVPAATGTEFFANPDFQGIDRPQRFGDTPYSQFDPGQSSLRLDLPFVSAGLSTANQAWGPGQEFPVLLGNNAGGFPHAFLGTSEPVNIFIAKLHGKVFWGALFQSDFSTVTGPDVYYNRAEPGKKRFATGLIVVAEPRGIPGLEVGGARFFHITWPISGIPRSYFTEVFQGFLKKNIDGPVESDPRFPAGNAQVGLNSNELVSVFGRWVLPHSGFELHAEYGRDDHSYDLRDLTQEPDHSRVYSLGARKVFGLSRDAMTAGRFEIMNFQVPQLARYRGEGEIYVHGAIRQGHTYKGQMLGADAGVGSGAGSVTAVDHFSKNGSWTASWHRIVNREYGNYLALGVLAPRSIDVTHALSFEMTRFMGPFDLNGGLTLARDFNRNFQSDVTNVNALVGVRYNVR